MTTDLIKYHGPIVRSTHHPSCVRCGRGMDRTATGGAWDTWGWYRDGDGCRYCPGCAAPYVAAAFAEWLKEHGRE
jgi:hypothetical protein